MPRVTVKKATGLKAKLAAVKSKPKTVLWKGPEDDGDLGGITQSMLNGFLGCRERFRLKYVEGLQPSQGFNKTIEYGQMWHLCEEALAAGTQRQVTEQLIGERLLAYAKSLCKQYPLQQEEIEKWFQVAKIQFPLYVEYWKKHPDNLKRTPLMQEQVFHVPYTLPSGRTVYLRGKFDAVDLIGTGKTAGIYLQENKTKGDIDAEKLAKQLLFDLQSMTYLAALSNREKFPMCQVDVLGGKKKETAWPIKGIRYNVIRRPLSGGRGSIVRHKGTANKPEETYESYYSRLSAIIKEDCESPEPEKNQYWFSRWKVEVSQQDIEAFKVQFLNPILEQLCDWYSWINAAAQTGSDPFNGNDGTENSKDVSVHSYIHYRMPFGVWNPLTDGSGASEYDSYLESGSTAGLTRVDTLFRELQ